MCLETAWVAAFAFIGVFYLFERIYAFTTIGIFIALAYLIELYIGSDIFPEGKGDDGGDLQWGDGDGGDD